MDSSSTITKEAIHADADINTEEIKLFQQINELIIKKELISSGSRSSKVWEYNSPEDLKAKLNLDLGKKPVSHEELMEEFKKILEYSTHTGHPRFMNQQYAARDLYALLGTFVTEAINPNCHTYEVSPVCVLLELEMVKKMGQYVGYRENQFDGIFTPGGSLATMHAIHLARYRWNRQTKEQGVYGFPRLTLFTSEACHYCVLKGASFLGFGLQSVYQVNTDSKGKMDPQDLEKKIMLSKDKGEQPFFVNATCGTTVLGAFDPLEPISDICARNNMWLHADGAWGGSVLVSEKHRHLVKGIEKADTVSWNAHKMLGVPLQCSMLLVKQKGLLEDCFGLEASYLFQTDKFYDTSYDIGSKLLQCGRKSEGLKLWAMWKARGDEGITDKVDKAMNNAHFLTETLAKRQGFKLVLPEYQYTNISFWYIPKRLRDQPESEEWWKEIHQVAPKIKERMVKKGSLMIGYQPLESKNYVNFFRVIVENPACTFEDMQFVVDEIDTLGMDL